MFNRKQSFVEKHSSLLVAAATVIGSGIAAYFGSRKATTEVMTTAATAVVGAVQNMQAPQHQQEAPVQAEAAVEITEAIADAIEEKANGKEEPKAEPATPSDAPAEKAEAEENK